MWESHSEQKRGSSPATDGHPKCKRVSSDPWELRVLGKIRSGRNRGLRCLGLMWSGVFVGNPWKRGVGAVGTFLRECCTL